MVETEIEKRAIIHDIILAVTAIALFLFFFFMPT